MDKDTQKVMFSSEKNIWETPTCFFEELDAEFHFTLDAAASHTNHKCARYFTAEDNGLEQDWGGETVFCNPPYGNKETGLWTKKCYEEAQKPGTTVVMLIPARTDRASFHDYIQGKAEVRFVRGRLKFELDGKPILDKDGRPMGAPFPSMVVIFRPPKEEEPLTLEELRGMDKQVVRVVHKKSGVSECEHESIMLVHVPFKSDLVILTNRLGDQWAFREQCQLYVSRLKVFPYHPAHIDRGAWGMCKVCECERIMFRATAVIDCPAGSTDMSGPVRFCPWCGHPLIPEAWAELEKRVMV